jgi:hypothetical protein
MRLVADAWALIWPLFWLATLGAYLLALSMVVIDLFRDRSLAGGWKALWLLCLVLLPFVVVLVYVIVRGPGMRERVIQDDGLDGDGRQFSGRASPAIEIATARTLRDDGTITESEYELIKGRALVGARGRSGDTASAWSGRSTG